MANALTAVDVAKQAKQHLKELTGLQPEIVSFVHFDDRFWYVGVEALEITRIPPTTDILNSYSVKLDGDGHLVEYKRLRRYYRNQTQELEDP